jgi:hypothetical protein
MKIAAMYSTEIYVNEEGQIAIKQTDPMGEPDIVVSFPAELAETITAEILRLVPEAKAVQAEKSVEG